ncbi:MULTISPECIES: NADPH-dependent FMN reductase [unclassified Moraxella]|uniref:NADPH-dependent FMN reductase n=1 Tax=unclassified Moraxella TaxID=2685852 RepID=UPI003AF787CD
MKIAFIIGSLRKESFNRKVAEQVKAIAPASWEIEEVKLDDLPLYNQDFDEQTIDSYERVRKQIKQADAVIFFTPEYNRSLPACAKNVIDIATRPSGNNLWAGKKVAISTASMGGWAGSLSAVDLQKILFMLGSQVSTTMANFANVGQIFDEKGEMNDQKSKQFLQKFVNDFDAMLAK